MPPGPRTGFAHPDCYANETADCDARITREHYISENVLKCLNVTEVVGAAWQPDPEQLGPASPASLTSRMLCERHNNALSPLDDAGGEFVQALLRFDHALRDGEPPVQLEEVVLNGADVERWMLKI